MSDNFLTVTHSAGTVAPIFLRAIQTRIGFDHQFIKIIGQRSVRFATTTDANTYREIKRFFVAR
ncbi:Uncharacterised protein [Escherichia coli]|uniref:Uncharacterized protein n=1 Tax=Escherichia coli TaxID=562 RepID=A0A376UA87_ECOLX|nr:Uncharacterised protein [Escherichia coli]